VIRKFKDGVCMEVGTMADRSRVDPISSPGAKGGSVCWACRNAYGWSMANSGPAASRQGNHIRVVIPFNAKRAVMLLPRALNGGKIKKQFDRARN